MDIIVTSFGKGHPQGVPERQHLVVDVSDLLYNPARDADMRYLTGRHAKVIDQVMNTPGSHDLVSSLIQFVGAAMRAPRDHTDSIRVAIGCVGGRHRSVVLATRLTAALSRAGLSVRQIDRDIDKPVLTSNRH